MAGDGSWPRQALAIWCVGPACHACGGVIEFNVRPDGEELPGGAITVTHHFHGGRGLCRFYGEAVQDHIAIVGRRKNDGGAAPAVP